MTTQQGTIDWCGKQMGDLNKRLFRQGFHPARVAWLVEHNAAFRAQYHGALAKMEELMQDMTVNSVGFHHFDAFSALKRELLTYTSRNRDELLATRVQRAA